MRKVVAIAVCAATILGGVGSAVAQSEFDRPIKARKAVMQLYAHYLGGLSAMAKGEAEYDAERAGAMAASLQAVASVDQSAMWPQGSDNAALGDATTALPAIWETYPAIVDKAQGLNTAVEALVAAASTDLASLQGAMGGVGGACGACHKEFRQSDN